MQNCSPLCPVGGGAVGSDLTSSSRCQHWQVAGGAGGGDHRWSGSTFLSHSGFATDFPGTSLPLSGLHVVNEGQAGWEGVSGPFQH